MSHTATETATGTWNVDPAHSNVAFALDYMAGKFRGTFSPVEATLVVDGEGTIELNGSAKVADIKVQDENLEAHLQSPEFFDGERHPELSFSANNISRGNGSEVTVDGELTMKGVTKPVELTGTISDPLTDGYGRERINLNLETTVDRTQFGIEWNLPLPNGEPSLSNDVTITAELYFVKAQA